MKFGIILGAVIFVGAIAIDIYLPVMPAIAADLGASVSGVQTTLTVYFLAFGIAQLVYGPWSDRVGRKPPLYAGLIIFLVGTLVCAFSPTIEWLVVGRGLQGLGGAAQMVIVRAVVRDKFEGTDATRLMGYVMMVTAISPLVAPLAGSLLEVNWGWRWIFGLLSVLTVFAVMLAFGALEETNPKPKKRQHQEQKTSFSFSALMRDRNFLSLTLLSAFGFAGMFVHISAGAFVYQGQFGLSSIEFSFVLAANSVAFFTTAILSSKLSSLWGASKVLTLAALGYTFAAIALVIFAAIGTLTLEILVGLMFVSNGFLGLLIPLSMVHALDNQGSQAGLASSISGTVQMLVGGVVIAVFSVWFDGDAQTMAVGISSCALVALIIQVLPRKHQPETVINTPSA